MVTVSGEDFGEDYFEALTGQLVDHDDWSYRSGQYHSLEEAVSEAAEGNIAEVDFVHDTTGAVLTTQIPVEDFESAMYGRLRNSVVPEPQETRRLNSLLSDLGEAYDQIGEDHVTEYTDTAESGTDEANFDLLNLAVPWDYDSGSLDEALDEMSEAASEAEQLNDSIRRPVRDFLK